MADMKWRAVVKRGFYLAALVAMVACTTPAMGASGSVDPIRKIVVVDIVGNLQWQTARSMRP
jgi:hypothetical protein